jgi:nitroreductase/NAD-dependent dihydropyrimidine dehydrogenase PreA subunit
MNNISAILEPPAITVDSARCTGCGVCQRICPVRIFKVTERKSAVARTTHECCLCGQCLAACTGAAINHSGFDVSRFGNTSETAVGPDSAFDLLAQRRSVRNYEKKVPSRELIEKIIDIAGYSPGSPHHRIGWVRNFSVVQGYDAMKLVLDMTAEYLRKVRTLIDSPVVRFAARFDASAKAAQAVLPDIEMRLKEYDEGRDAILYNAPVAIFAHAPLNSSMPHSDCCAAVSYIQLYAYANGIGTCWNGLLQMAAAGEHVKNFTKLSEFLRIPHGNKCFAAITAGYPSLPLKRIPRRSVDIGWIQGTGV